MKIKRLQEQCLGVRLLAKEIEDQMDTIRFTLVSLDIKNEDVDRAVKKVCALATCLSMAGENL